MSDDVTEGLVLFKRIGVRLDQVGLGEWEGKKKMNGERHTMQSEGQETTAKSAGVCRLACVREERMRDIGVGCRVCVGERESGRRKNGARAPPSIIARPARIQ